MKGIRRLQHESLESRRLLAAHCELPSGIIDAQPAVLTSNLIAEGEAVGTAASNDVLEGLRAAGDKLGDVALPFVGNFNLGIGPDLIQEQGDKLYVVDQDPFLSPEAKLVVFQRTAEATLEVVHEIELGFSVGKMIVQDDQVLLFGRSTHWLAGAERFVSLDPATDVASINLPQHPTTIVATVNLGAEVEVIRQEFEGTSRQIHHEGDRIVMISSSGNDVVIAIYPPPPLQGVLRTFDITPDGLREVASREIPLISMTEVHGDTLVAAHVVVTEVVYLDDAIDPALLAASIRAPDDGTPLPHFVSTVVLTQYHLGDDVIEKVDEFEVGNGLVFDVELSDDGQTAIVVTAKSGERRLQSKVTIVQLSREPMRVLDTVSVTAAPLAVYTDHVLLSNRDGTLFIVDTNTQIDLAAENRIRRLELPANLKINRNVRRIHDDRIVVMATRIQEAGDHLVPPNSLHLQRPSHVDAESILLTISLDDGRIISDWHLGDGNHFARPNQFFEIDAQRFGFFADETSAAEDRGVRFIFGRLGEDGEFHPEGSIPARGWLEFDANSERLIARQSDRLVEYRWENIDEPIITPLGEPDPTIEAVNDAYRLNDNGDDHLLDVLANDVIHRPQRSRVEIVELIGAPEGAEIIHGHLVKIPAAALEGKESLRFEYVISDGQSTSSAVVEVDVFAISQERVRELVERIRHQAAEDFDVPVEEIDITFVERIFDQPLPIVPPIAPDHPLDLSPGILVTLRAPGATALYAASLEGEIVQVFSSVREDLVELGLRAVNENGDVVNQLVAGEEFWLEFTARDLRSFGAGVYAAFFDLIVPTEHITLTDVVEFGEGFIGIRHGSISEGLIDDLGAIGDQIEPPGNNLQQILRIRATAVAAGEVTLAPEFADARGTETLIHGRDTAVENDRVRFTPLTLTILDSAAGDRLDADGDGSVSARDALVVINFLHRFGTTSLQELSDRVARLRGEGETPVNEEMAMRRYDTNGSGMITALDALIVVNHLVKQTPVIADAESVKAGIDIGSNNQIRDDQLRGLF